MRTWGENSMGKGERGQEEPALQASILNFWDMEWQTCATEAPPRHFSNSSGRMRSAHTLLRVVWSIAFEVKLWSWTKC